MDTTLCTKRNVTPSQTVEVFRKHGEEITEEEAEILLEFLYFFAKLSVCQQVEKKKNGT